MLSFDVDTLMSVDLRFMEEFWLCSTDLTWSSGPVSVVLDVLSFAVIGVFWVEFLFGRQK